MFTYRYGDRPDVTNLAIVLTDGQTNDAGELTQQAQMVCQSTQLPSTSFPHNYLPSVAYKSAASANKPLSGFTVFQSSTLL